MPPPRPPRMTSTPRLRIALAGVALFTLTMVAPTSARAAATIDSRVSENLRRLEITPSSVCSDTVFVRRVYLDVIGTLPSPAEVDAFLKNPSPDKRASLIEHLLRREEFADYWAMKWCDLLRVKAEFPVNLWPNAAQAYHRWVRAAIRDNLPCDRFARELMTSSGSNFRSGPANFFRAVPDRKPDSFAAAAALAFMGQRTEFWSEQQRANLAVFFSRVRFKPTLEWKEEIVYFDPLSPAVDKAVLPDGRKVTLKPDQDPREVFADWLVAKDNPIFARAMANRTWAWLMGRGIVHEPDDMRADNPPANPALLDLLADELVRSGYDQRHLYRLILNSQTYQRSPLPPAGHPDAAAHFACYPLRRLEAEVLIDAINQITGTDERYWSAIPEPFTFIPLDTRAIALPDGSITSSFLELFGRPARDTGLQSERNNQPSAGQTLHLLNSTHIQDKLAKGPGLQPLLKAKGAPQAVLDKLYLAILSRPPTDEERAAVDAFARSPGAGSPRDATLDVAWALINTAEFPLRH